MAGKVLYAYMAALHDPAFVRLLLGLYSRLASAVLPVAAGTPASAGAVSQASTDSLPLPLHVFEDFGEIMLFIVM